MRRAPARPVRALCEAVAVLLSKNMTCAWPRCNATPSEDFLHTSHCTLHTPRFTLHTCTSHSALHLISNRKKDDFEALFKRNLSRKITSAKIEKICLQITVAALLQPLQYDLRDPAAKHNGSIAHAAAAPSNLDAATTMRSANTEL